MSKSFVLGVDVGGTNFRVGLINEERKLENFKIESSKIFENVSNPLGVLQEYLELYLGSYLSGELLGIAIGFPATISKDKRIVYSAPNLKGFDNLELADRLEKKFNVPVFLDRDVNYLLMHDIVVYNLPKKGIVAGFYIGTGIGNAIYIDGKFISGKNGVAGELGHIPVLNSKERCTCGNIGCIEIYSSGKTLYNLWEQNFKDEIEFEKIFIKHNHKNSTLIRNFIDAISIAISTEINILDPDYIVIGGGVINIEKFPKDYLEQCIFEHVRKPYPAATLSYIYSLDKKEAGVLGGAYYAFSRLTKE